MPESTRPTRSVLKVLMGVVVAIGLGAFLGIVGAFVQADRGFVGTFTIPWGTALVLATLLLTMRAMVALTSRRLEAAVLGAVWVLVSLVMSAKTPSGDVAISAASWSVVYLFGGVILVGLAASLPPRTRPATGIGRASADGQSRRSPVV